MVVVSLLYRDRSVVADEPLDLSTGTHPALPLDPVAPPCLLNAPMRHLLFEHRYRTNVRQTRVHATAQQMATYSGAAPTLLVRSYTGSTSTVRLTYRYRAPHPLVRDVVTIPLLALTMKKCTTATLTLWTRNSVAII